MKGYGDGVRGRDLLVKVRNSSRGKSKRSARMRRHPLCIILWATSLCLRFWTGMYLSLIVVEISLHSQHHLIFVLFNKEVKKKNKLLRRITYCQESSHKIRALWMAQRVKNTARGDYTSFPSILLPNINQVFVWDSIHRRRHFTYVKKSPEEEISWLIYPKRQTNSSKLWELKSKLPNRPAQQTFSIKGIIIMATTLRL